MRISRELALIWQGEAGERRMFKTEGEAVFCGLAERTIDISWNILQGRGPFYIVKRKFRVVTKSGEVAECTMGEDGRYYLRSDMSIIRKKDVESAEEITLARVLWQAELK